MSAHPDYTPPSSAQIHAQQNESESLRLLIAQRRLYRRAKRWLAFRWLGMAIIGIGAPLVSVLWPSLAVASGAVAGVWLFLGRTLVILAQSSLTAKAAAVQEKFDFRVFGMPDGKRSISPSLEDVAEVVGPDDQIPAVADREKLLDWYPVDPAADGDVTVAISQRANASYSDRLLRTTAIVWAVATAGWIIVLVLLSVALNVSLSTFILGVAFPVLPAFLDVVQHAAGVWQSAAQRRDLAQVIETRLLRSDGPVKGHELLIWQERLFELRRSAPQVPDFIYKLRRKLNERAMHSAARQLGNEAASDD